MKDYYSILGVPKGSSPEEIKRAYRRLASQHHPDKGGDKTQFQEIQEAYQVLGDAESRRSYDNPHVGRPHFASMNGFNLDDLFGMFGHGMGARAAATARLTLWLTLEDVARGGARIISLQVNHRVQNVEITIPPGVNDGDSVRYPGLAPDANDLVITFRVHPNDRWQRNGRDLVTSISVSAWDLVLGCEQPVKDILGNDLLLAIPAMTQPGTLLRMKGRGLASNQMPGRQQTGSHGDLLIRVQAFLPNNIDRDLLDHIRRARGQ